MTENRGTIADFSQPGAPYLHHVSNLSADPATDLLSRYHSPKANLARTHHGQT